MKKGMYKFLNIISSFCLCMSFFLVPVKAETDIIYPDPSQYTAFEYFFTHGYNHLLLSSSNNITYDVSLDNIGTNNGSITGTDNLSGSSHNTGTINSNGSSTLGAKYMVCSTNNGTSASQTYSCYFSNRQNAVSNSQSINIGFNENTYSDFGNVDVGVNETINQRINTDITGQITSSTSDRSYVYLPWLTGTYTHESAFSWNTSVSLFPNNDVYLIFYTYINIGNPTVNFYKYAGNPSDSVPKFTWTKLAFNHLYLNVIRLYTEGSSGYYSFDLPDISSPDIMPMYYGFLNNMPDEIALNAGIRKSTNTLLTEQNTLLNTGNNDTSSSVNSASNANSQVSQKINQFDSIENDSVNDMSSKINNLNVTPDIIANSKFISSAAWVKTQFDHMTIGTPIGAVLAFSLLLGVALIFVGKYR